MQTFEQRNAYFDRLCNTPGLMWLGQNTNHFDPPPSVREAIIRALDSGEYHAYAPPLGFEELRKLIAEDMGLPDATVMVTDGAVQALFNVCSNICVPGTRFITTDPSWAWPMHFARKAGSEVVQLPIYDAKQGYKLTPSQLKAAVDEKTQRGLSDCIFCGTLRDGKSAESTDERTNSSPIALHQPIGSIQKNLLSSTAFPNGSDWLECDWVPLSPALRLSRLWRRHHPTTLVAMFCRNAQP